MTAHSTSPTLVVIKGGGDVGSAVAHLLFTMSESNPKLRFGLWYAFRNPAQWRRSYQDMYAEIIEQIVWAEEIGYDDVWLTEHHFAEDGHAPSPLPQAAAIAVKTKKMRIGTGVLLLPLYNPVRVAEDGATIDIYLIRRTI